MSERRFFATPRNLDELAINVMTTPCNALKQEFPNIIKDYLSQKFAMAMYKDPSHSKILQDLFDKCVIRHK